LRRTSPNQITLSERKRKCWSVFAILVCIMRASKAGFRLISFCPCLTMFSHSLLVLVDVVASVFWLRIVAKAIFVQIHTSWADILNLRPCWITVVAKRMMTMLCVIGTLCWSLSIVFWHTRRFGSGHYCRLQMIDVSVVGCTPDTLRISTVPLIMDNAQHSVPVMNQSLSQTFGESYCTCSKNSPGLGPTLSPVLRIPVILELEMCATETSSFVFLNFYHNPVLRTGIPSQSLSRAKTHVGFHAKCPLLFSDLFRNLNVSTNFIKTYWYQISWTSVQRFSIYYIRTDRAKIIGAFWQLEL
jgi:hypothetical protein